MRQDLAQHCYDEWFRQVAKRIEQMHLPHHFLLDRLRSWGDYFDQGYSPREAVRAEVAYRNNLTVMPKVHRSSA